MRDAALLKGRRAGLSFDPRTKLLLLVTMTTFVLGGAGSSEGLSGLILRIVLLALCALPVLLLISTRAYRAALAYVLIYGIAALAFYQFGGTVVGLPNFLLLATTGIITRLMPGLMLGIYVVSTTTVSEFMAAMGRMRISEKITIPLSVMFRFFPTIADEFASINAAMRMRGVSLGGSNGAKMLEYRLIPLMVCSARIGEELSVAALTRGLGANVRRTNRCRIGFHAQDLCAIAFCAGAFLCLIVNITGLA
ncbi:MAG: energy-coupling factor transporter transmembrane protein EcfT [Coriobacteriales bacterium]|jgi:energy-coupling factor transport system permease protein|nr:energy-coupling factor transporter transmembrane protein EcfT [Coriobacteriales bacterium]